ncbi:MAG: hypothetical protein HC854_12505 [Flavobacterium sp.]|nr:hypothetical protein [Flavobacterium sp.]
MNAYGYTSLISEITYWDELVNFAENGDIVWFDNSLTYLVDTYKADYIDVYNIDNKFVAKASSTLINSKDFIPKEVFPILYKEKHIKFYVKIPEGIAFVFGATIHPSEDPYKNKTKPRGYFFMVKLMNDKYFQNLESISNSSAEYLVPGKNFIEKKGFITTRI